MDSTPNRYAAFWEQHGREEREELFASEILPKQTTWDAQQRARHQDLSALSDDQLLAERTVLTVERSQRVFYRTKREWVHLTVEPMSDLDWLAERIDRLTKELQRRQRRGRAA